MPALLPDIGILPMNNVVSINIGANGNSVTLIPSPTGESLLTGNCVNGLPNGTIFGQVAYCNSFNFFTAINNNLNNIYGLVRVPLLQNSLLGDICPTTRSFGIVDQDQSDNVITQYLITSNGQVAQDTPNNRLILNVTIIVGNGSDNRLLSDFVDVAIGCTPFTAPDLVNNTILKSSLALNEIHASLNSPLLPTTALIPPNDPMVLDNGQISLAKINLYREGVDQPVLQSLTGQENINYCNGLNTYGVPFIILHQNEFALFASPDKTANNLLNFLCRRFAASWVNLQCPILTGNQSAISVTIDPNTNMAVSNNLSIMPSTSMPTSGVTSVPTSAVISVTYVTSAPPMSLNLCGNAYNNVNCTETCPNGLDTECITQGYLCYNILNAIQLCNYTNFCGINANNVTCNEPCKTTNDCSTNGTVCLNDTLTTCLSNVTSQHFNLTANDTTKISLTIFVYILITFIGLWIS